MVKILGNAIENELYMNNSDKEKNIKEAVSWYTQHKELYRKFAQKIEGIILEILAEEKIPIHGISNRVKEVNRFAKKIEKPQYTNPKEEITDLAGIRIIACVESDLVRICEVIKKNFKIDTDKSIDKSKDLGNDKVGYKSIHFIGELKSERLKLPEYKKFKNLVFEIQVRTILQHAWAEIEHDRNYKFSGKLPDEIVRRLKVLAGTLELVDREFNLIAAEIDKITHEVEQGTETGNIDIEINSTSLRQYLLSRFKKHIAAGLSPEIEDEPEIIEELEDYGIKTLSDFDKIIPKDFDEVELQVLKEEEDSFAGLIRNVLIINDHQKYFSRSWKENWHAMEEGLIVSHYNIPITEIASTYDIDIIPYGYSEKI